jgi:hypothetical protein
MKTLLSEVEFTYWQDMFHSRFWNGQAYDCRNILSQATGNKNYFETGAIFYTVAGSLQPSTIQEIALNDSVLVDTEHPGIFAALEDRFVVIQGNYIYNFRYEQCQDYETGWIRQKILTRVAFHNHEILSLLINTWMSRNMLQRFFSNDEVVKSVMGKYASLQPLFQDMLGKDVNPRVAEMYEDFRKTLASFLRFVSV